MKNELGNPAIRNAKCAAARAGVAPERQKIMVKGGLLKDDGDWAKAGVKPGQRLMMIGTAEAVPTAPTTQQVNPQVLLRQRMYHAYTCAHICRPRDREGDRSA